MKDYEIGQNNFLDKINNYFLTEFEKEYNRITKSGKRNLLKYAGSFFRKWYFSSLVSNTVITPSFLMEYEQEDYSVYPVLKNNSISRIGSIEINNIKFSLDNHPICNDFKALVLAFRKGIFLDDLMQMKFEDIKSIGNITTYDPEYISYLVMLGIDMGYIEKMPSLRTSMYCASNKADGIEKADNRTLLKAMVKAGVKIAATFLSDEFMEVRHNVSEDMVMRWLAQPIPVDKIFEEAYEAVTPEITESAFIENMDDIEMAIATKTYMRGITIDKWFLTPFSTYFRFVNLTYMCQFFFCDEFGYFINAINFCKEMQDEDEIICSALYAPCTVYRLTRLGSEFFDVEYRLEKPYIFKSMNTFEILDTALYEGIDGAAKIINAYEPEFDIFTFKVSIEDSDELFCELQARTDITLDKLHSCIASVFELGLLCCKDYKFYKLPKSPFTEYAPKIMKERGPYTEDTPVSSVIEKGEKLYYEILIYNYHKELKTVRLTIELTDVSINEKGVSYPNVLETGRSIFKIIS